MVFKKLGDTYVVRLDINDEVLSSLYELFEKENINGATITGIGACNFVELATYRLEQKKYITKTFEENLEMTSLTGNVTRQGDSRYLHLHATFSDEEMNLKGGHLNKAIISIVGEIFVRVTQEEIEKITEPEKGIYIFNI